MKIHCNVIRDLLPLYVEQLTSKESNQFIEEHLSGCEKCRQELSQLDDKKTAPNFESEELVPLAMMKKDISKRKRKSVMLITAVVFLIMFTLFSYLTKPIYCSYENSGIVVSENEKKEVYANFAGDITAYRMERYVSDNGKNIVELEVWTSVWDKILRKSTPSVLVATKETTAATIYFCDVTKSGTMEIVYGENPYPSGGVVALPRVALNYYLILAILLTVLTGVVWLLVRKNRRMNQIGRCIFFIPVSYILSVILLQNIGATFSISRDFIMNLIATIGIYGICILGWDCFKQYREDKTIY